MKLKQCPECQSALTVRVYTDRRNQQFCPSSASYTCCGWEGEPYAPETQRVEDSKLVSVGGWCFQLFDQYGNPYLDSRNYGSQNAAIEEARKMVNKLTGKPGFCPCEAVVWPPDVRVFGARVR